MRECLNKTFDYIEFKITAPYNFTSKYQYNAQFQRICIFFQKYPIVSKFQRWNKMVCIFYWFIKNANIPQSILHINKANLPFLQYYFNFQKIIHRPVYEQEMQKDVVIFSLVNCTHLDLMIAHVFWNCKRWDHKVFRYKFIQRYSDVSRAFTKLI